MGKINNDKATLLFDSGAEVSIIDTTFARKGGCVIDESCKQECVGIGENVYMTVGRTKIKVALAGSLVYFSMLGLAINLVKKRSLGWIIWFQQEYVSI